MVDIAGFETVVTLDGTDITVRLNDVAFDRVKTTKVKSSMNGTGIPDHLVTMKDGTLTLSGQVDDAGHETLEATFAKDTTVTFSVVVGDGTVLDAGTYAGDVVIDGMPLEASASDTWNFSLSAVGWLTYTAPV